MKKYEKRVKDRAEKEKKGRVHSFIIIVIIILLAMADAQLFVELCLADQNKCIFYFSYTCRYYQ